MNKQGIEFVCSINKEFNKIEQKLRDNKMYFGISISDICERIARLGTEYKKYNPIGYSEIEQIAIATIKQDKLIYKDFI